MTCRRIPTTPTTSASGPGRPLDKPMWFNVGKKPLYDKVEGARDFITKGTVVSEKHGTIYVSNVNHAQAYLDDAIMEGTLEAPFVLASLPALYAVPPVAAPVAPGSMAPPPLPAAMPATLDDLGPASKRLAINPVR